MRAHVGARVCVACGCAYVSVRLRMCLRVCVGGGACDCGLSYVPVCVHEWCVCMHV